MWAKFANSETFQNWGISSVQNTQHMQVRKREASILFTAISLNSTFFYISSSHNITQFKIKFTAWQKKNLAVNYLQAYYKIKWLIQVEDTYHRKYISL